MKLRQKKELKELDMVKAKQKIQEQLQASASLQESSNIMLKEAENCRLEREDRVQQFLHYLDVKRNEYLQIS